MFSNLCFFPKSRKNHKTTSHLAPCNDFRKVVSTQSVVSCITKDANFRARVSGGTFSMIFFERSSFFGVYSTIIASIGWFFHQLCVVAVFSLSTRLRIRWCKPVYYIKGEQADNSQFVIFKEWLRCYIISLRSQPSSTADDSEYGTGKKRTLIEAVSIFADVLLTTFYETQIWSFQKSGIGYSRLLHAKYTI